MIFEQQKRQFLNKPDKSLAKQIDKAILPLVRIINSKSFFYTTSSCSGRIILMKETGKKQENAFLFRTHEKNTLKEIKKAIDSAAKKYKGTIYLKHEPCIMHVACRNLEMAIKLVSVARSAGWKKSGVFSIKKDKVMCELVSTEILSAPVMNKGEMIVSDKYLKILVNECNNKLMRTRTKIKKLERVI